MNELKVKVPEDDQAKLRLEEARLFWSRGEGNTALGIVQSLTNQIPKVGHDVPFFFLFLEI